QAHLVGPGKLLRRAIEADRISSLILYGPPGCGKTALAHVIAQRTQAHFEPLNATSAGVDELRRVIARAKERSRVDGRRTILFIDEIHRFNKAQQDAFLPHVEKGTIVLIGATTENPSFEVVRPLLSRAPVFVLEALTPWHIRTLLDRALHDRERGLGATGVSVTDAALDLLASGSDGDARRGLGALEVASQLAGQGDTVDEGVAREALQHRFAIYDKEGEEHYNLISALHKAVRGSDPDAALYWVARMIRGGEDPLYIARRLERMASEDIGLADPRALQVAVAARDSYHFLGSPEGELAIAEVAVYLATAPKSNRLYLAWSAAVEAAGETPAEPVPLPIRNAPTGLLRDLGYGEGYRYDPDWPDGVAPQEYLPDKLRGVRFYSPSECGEERSIGQRLAWWEDCKRRAADQPVSAPAGQPVGGSGAVRRGYGSAPDGGAAEDDG
ncbi:MAG: replication-associated recombination protein A, partial [Gemmatimonadetes bacterium]|nr:replication-associated recombination protein A [Gemmatimonadota bacterium]